MPLAYSIDTEPIRRLERAIRKFDQELETNPPSSSISDGLESMTEKASYEAYSITHQWTRTLYRSYLTSYETGEAKSTIYVDPTVINPLGYYPSVYAAYEFARGGSHDAFGRVVKSSERFVLPGIREIFNKASSKAVA